MAKKKQTKKAKEVSDEQAIMKIAKAMEDNPGFEDREIEIHETQAGTLILLNKNELYSVERDYISGRAFLLELSCPEAIRTYPKPKK